MPDSFWPGLAHSRRGWIALDLSCPYRQKRACGTSKRGRWGLIPGRRATGRSGPSPHTTRPSKPLPGPGMASFDGVWRPPEERADHDCGSCENKTPAGMSPTGTWQGRAEGKLAMPLFLPEAQGPRQGEAVARDGRSGPFRHNRRRHDLLCPSPVERGLRPLVVRSARPTTHRGTRRS